jgi:molybdenum cofactor biosynthesis protein B
MPAPNHKGKVVQSVACAVITVSDTRTTKSDSSGLLIRELLASAGHTVHNYLIVRDDFRQIRAVLIAFRDAPACQAVLLSGGTGISKRDVTCEVLDELIDKRLDGFGELFRLKSYEQIGPAAMLSRAVAGTMRQTAVFAMPGSQNAVRLAMTELVLPELGHIVHLATKPA